MTGGEKMEIVKKAWTKPEVEELSVNKQTEHIIVWGKDGGYSSSRS